jgi:ABC-type dipeptide/oligopeptide/nickel transport system ATPase component
MNRMLEVEGLRLRFFRDGAWTEALRGISFSLDAGASLGLVGGSGSGKSVLALSLAALLPLSGSCEQQGSVRFDGREVREMRPRELARHRGGQVAYVFQDPGASLHPFHRVGRQVAEALLLHAPEMRPAVRRAAVMDALAAVGFDDPQRVFDLFPWQMSGGMQQRLMVAIALACRSRLLVADEPTTALDSITQAQVLGLLASVCREHGLALLLITHNFGILEGLVDEVLVLRDGQEVERGPTAQVLHAPACAYTRELLSCVPRLGQRLPSLVALPSEEGKTHV